MKIGLKIKFLLPMIVVIIIGMGNQILVHIFVRFFSLPKSYTICSQRLKR